MGDPRCDDDLQAEVPDCRVEAWPTTRRSRIPPSATAPAARYSMHVPRSESIGWEIREPGDRLVLNKVAPSRVPCRTAQYQLARARCFRSRNLGAARNLGANSHRNWRPPVRQNRHTAQSIAPPQFPRGIAFRQRLQIVKSETWHFVRDFGVDISSNWLTVNLRSIEVHRWEGQFGPPKVCESMLSLRNFPAMSVRVRRNPQNHRPIAVAPKVALTTNGV